MRTQRVTNGGPGILAPTFNQLRLPPYARPISSFLLGLTVSLNAWSAQDTAVGPPDECGYGCDFLSYAITGDQLRLFGRIPRYPPAEEWRFTDLWWWADLPQRTGWTTELKLDLLSVTVDSSSTADEVFTLFVGDTWPTPLDQGGYGICKDANEIGLLKYHDRLSSPWKPFTLLFWEELEIKNQQITLVLSMTWLTSGVRVTARVEDLENEGEILYQRSFFDGPGIDAGVGDPHFKGVDAWQADNGSVYGLKNCFFGVWDVTPGYNPPWIEVVAGNLRYSHTTYLNFNKAVCLSWPVAAVGYHVEFAESLDGEWRVLEGALESDDDATQQHQVWVMAQDQARFFRLVEDEAP